MTRNRKKRIHDEIDHSTDQTSANSSPDESEILEREHQEVTKVKYIEWVRYGKYIIRTWYYSPFPEDYRRLKNLFICDFCMKYMKQERTYQHHLYECERKHPPGSEIYRHANLAIYEVYGKDNKVYCQCMCLLAKLFLDNKTVIFDLDDFVFYVLCELEDDGAHMVGYFSKQQDSPEHFNLACICILPPFQRSGYGKFLIHLSYQLSKLERTVGSPEAPLSDLGRVSYQSYWSWFILTCLDKSGELNVSSLSKETGIAEKDIIEAVHTMNLPHLLDRTGKVLYVTRATFEEYRNENLIKEPRSIPLKHLMRKRARPS